jgi:hypothetical protein
VWRFLGVIVPKTHHIAKSLHVNIALSVSGDAEEADGFGGAQRGRQPGRKDAGRGAGWAARSRMIAVDRAPGGFGALQQ